tara:strand:+ start:150 stop:674 length:525 start_codon:yes stop_codon:yes gene_type:complete
MFSSLLAGSAGALAGVALSDAAKDTFDWVAPIIAQAVDAGYEQQLGDLLGDGILLIDHVEISSIRDIRETMADADTSAEDIAALQSVEGEATQRMFQRIAASVETNNEYIKSMKLKLHWFQEQVEKIRVLNHEIDENNDKKQVIKRKAKSDIQLLEQEAESAIIQLEMFNHCTH